MTFCCLLTSSLTLLFHFPPPLYPSPFPAGISDAPRDCRHQCTPPVSTSACVSLTAVQCISACFLDVNYSDQLLALEFSAFPNLTVVVKVWDTGERGSSFFLPWRRADPQVHTYSVSLQVRTWGGRTSSWGFSICVFNGRGRLHFTDKN